MPISGVPVWKTGAYCWQNRVNGKVYVGGAYKNLQKRRRTHLEDLRAGRHFNKHLQNAWDKYGEAAFSFRVLERCAPENVREVEQKWIDTLLAADNNHGYNRSPTAGSCLGVKLSEETKARIGVGCRGIWIGRKHTEEAKAKMAAAARNRPPEVLAKMSASGKLKRLSPEHRAKIAAAGVGRKPSEETLDKMRGQKRTEATRANIAAGLQRHWAKVRQERDGTANG